MADFPPDNPVEEDETTESTEEDDTTESTEEEVQAQEDDQEEPITDQVVPSDAPTSPVMYNPHQYQVVPPLMYNPHQYQAFPNAVPAPMMLMLYGYQHAQAFPNPVPGQAPMIRPTTNNQNQDHVVPSLVSSQVPMIRPTTNNQDHVVPDVVPGQAPMIRPVTNNQNHPMANQMANQDPMQPPFPLPPNHTYNPRPVFVAFSNPQYQHNVAPFARIQYPYLRPEDNHQNLAMPQFRSDQMFSTTSPSTGELRSYVVLQDPFNPQQYCVMSLNEAVVIGPSPQQQLQPQIQPPVQSQGFNTGPSSSSRSRSVGRNVS